jgi:homoserine O-acetyltransferase
VKNHRFFGGLASVCWSIFLCACPAGADPVPEPAQADFVIKDFHFTSGQTLPKLKIHHRTLGTPATDVNGVVRNAVLILHGTTGSGNQFLNPAFAGELFGPGQLLDAGKFFLILPDDIGHGQSSRPSEGLHSKFPNYRYADMVDAEHRLVVDGLHVNHLRLVMGTSMGGMHTWMWGERYPNMADALMPLASLPGPIGGRNRMWRRMISEMIRADPAWAGGDYTTQPPSLRSAAQMLYFMGDTPRRRTDQFPTGDAADKALDAAADRAMKTTDANDTLYAVESSTDYDPSKNLEAIRVPLLAVNSADDLINPPDQQILAREIGRVPHGRAVLIPEGPETRGHGTHTVAKVWKAELERLLKDSEQQPNSDARK